MGKINYYNDSIQIEKRGQRDLYTVYKILYPFAERIEDVRGKDPQLLGIDHIIHQPGNATLTVQAKVRETMYTDVLLEYTSNDRTGSSGWIELPSLAQLFAYLIMPKKMCYYFSWRPLQDLWNAHKDEWTQFGVQKIHGFSRIIAPNVGYNTISVAVPAKVLLDNVNPSGVVIYE